MVVGKDKSGGGRGGGWGVGGGGQDFGPVIGDVCTITTSLQMKGYISLGENGYNMGGLVGGQGLRCPYQLYFQLVVVWVSDVII